MKRFLSICGAALVALGVCLAGQRVWSQPSDVAPVSERLPAPPTPPEAPEPPSKEGEAHGDFAEDAPVQRHSNGEVVEFGHHVVVPEGQTRRNVVVIGGNVRIDGKVERDVVVISGSAEVNGKVRGSMVVVMGGAKLGPNASIRRDAVVIGGPFDMHENAHIGKQRVVVGLTHLVPGLPGFGWMQQWFASGLMLARPFPPQYGWVWAIGALTILFYLMVTVVFPQPVRASVSALQERPVGSFFAGILLLVLLGPLMFLLAVSIVGLVAIPFVIIAGVLAAIFGTAAVYSYTGRQVLRPLQGAREKLPLVLLAGAAVCYLLYMVPFVGFAVWGIVSLLGLGAALLAAFRSFRRETAPAAGAPPVVVAGAIGAAGQPLSTGDVIVLPRVGFWRRAVATFLDFILLSWVLPTLGPLFLLVWTAYFVGMWTWKGTTVGGIVMGIKVVRLNGAPVDFAVALVRSLASYFSALVLGLGFFWAGWSREKQAWHDSIAGTLVVRMPRGSSLV